MLLESLFGSKAKIDIIKYLLFRRQGISIRALENQLERSFPAVKKQIDLLERNAIIDIVKDNNKRSITMVPRMEEFLRLMFLNLLQLELDDYLASHGIQHYYIGKLFVDADDAAAMSTKNGSDVDLMIVFPPIDDVPAFKTDVAQLFDSYFISMIKVVFFSEDDFAKRYKLADRFVLSVLKQCKKRIIDLPMP